MSRYRDCVGRTWRVVVFLHPQDGWLARCMSSGGSHLDDIVIEDADDDASDEEALEAAKLMFPDARVFLYDPTEDL